MGVISASRGAKKAGSKNVVEEESEDIALMAKIAKGDDEAFRRLIERHELAVFGAAVKMLQDRFVAEEITQKVFLRVYWAATRYRPTAKFRTWLFTILRRLVLNELRRCSSSALVFTGEDPWEGAPSASPRSPADLLEDKERLELVERAIASLPPKQRLAVVLKSYDDLSYEEIGRVLGLSLSATRALLFRARESLRKTLSFLRESR
ncbi:RNA polymerase sigma factor [Methylacidimicrobium sp. B4]|uniref:RNA polymerase sigma factor n=1 Tax=Methylacidimicrobium sp. B4 TaxID=2796139 RepID=UPI001A8E7C01|nr:RNA polymerase sigma factor [Methylacidimicrobium sp. B4]QSR84507.1 RNA polymerase sigma factor [Methylacidimicrobium sp. B4]